jgi:hypothetical protein
MNRYLAGMLAVVLFSTSAQAVTLIGQSATSTNPQVAGDATTGFFWNPTGGTVSTSIGGVDMFDVGPEPSLAGSGITVNGGLNFTGTNGTGSASEGGVINNRMAYNEVDNGHGSTRNRVFYDVVNIPANTTNIDEGFFLARQFSGSGIASHEINGYHAFFSDTAGMTMSGPFENYEASTIWNAAHTSAVDYLALQNVGATGSFSGALQGISFNVVNTNPTPGNIFEWDAVTCTPINVTGGGSLPTHEFCLKNADVNQDISTIGRMRLGSIANSNANEMLDIMGSDTSNTSYAVQMHDSAGSNTFYVTNAGTTSIRNTLQLGLLGSVRGDLIFFNATSGNIQMVPPTGALTNAVLTLPDDTSTVADISGTQTFTNKTLTAPTINGATIATSTVNGVTLSASGSATSYLDNTGAYSVPAGGGGGAVSSVSAADNTVVVTPTTGAVTVSAAVNSQAGAASTPALLLSGAPMTSGGTGTTTMPLAYIDPAGSTQPTTLSTAGTYFGVNTASGFAGNVIDIRQNGSNSALLTLTAGGALTTTNTISAAQFASSNATGNLFIANAFSNLNETAAGYQFAGSTNTGVRVGQLGTNSTALTVGANYSAFNVGSSPVTTSASGTNAWLANAVINPIGTVTSGGAAITNTTALFVGAPSAAGTNNYSLYVNGPMATAGTINGVSLTTGGSSSAFLNGAGTYTSPTVSVGAQGTATPFTSSGTFTTAASSSASTIYYYKMIAAGGGGGGANGALAAASAGGAGYYAEGTFTGVAASTAITITVGTGGVGGSATGGSGGSGGATTIGTPVSITAGGGGLGIGSTSATAGGLEGGAGGTLTSGTPNLANVAGAHGGRSQGTSIITLGGNGGSSPLGGGGLGGQSSVALTPTAATGYGAGGGGAIGTTTAGGSGMGGFVEITQLTP